MIVLQMRTAQCSQLGNLQGQTEDLILEKKKRITENLVYIVTTYVVDPCLGRTNRKYRRLYIFNILSLCLLLYYYQLVCIIIY